MCKKIHASSHREWLRLVKTNNMDVVQNYAYAGRRPAGHWNDGSKNGYVIVLTGIPGEINGLHRRS